MMKGGWPCEARRENLIARLTTTSDENAVLADAAWTRRPDK